MSQVPLTSYPGAEQGPSFSPDGSQVAFSWTGEDADNQDIYVTLADGGPRSRLTDDPAPDFSPAWSRDGSQIAFVRLRAGRAEVAEVRLVSPLGGPEQKLVEILSYVVADRKLLSWSADGQTLALSDRESSSKPARISLFSLETRRIAPLTDPPIGTSGDFSPAFSPDGSQVAFVRQADYRLGHIFVAALDGSPPRQVTDSPADIRWLAWSPNGEELFFTSEGPGPELWRVSVTGGNPRPVLGLGSEIGGLTFLVIRQSFSPMPSSGKSIATSGRFQSAPWANQVRSSPRRARTVTPQISPDGSRIAFRSERSGYPEIWVADIDGSNASQLTSLKSE